MKMRMPAELTQICGDDRHGVPLTTRAENDVHGRHGAGGRVRETPLSRGDGLCSVGVNLRWWHCDEMVAVTVYCRLSL